MGWEEIVGCHILHGPTQGKAILLDARVMCTVSQVGHPCDINCNHASYTRSLLCIVLDLSNGCLQGGEASAAEVASSVTQLEREQQLAMVEQAVLALHGGQHRVNQELALTSKLAF